LVDGGAVAEDLLISLEYLRRLHRSARRLSTWLCLKAGKQVVFSGA